MPVLLTQAPGIADAPIIKKEIQELVDYYYETLVNKNDALSAWVSTQEVKDLIKANEGANGIRILYGRHKPGTIIKEKDYSNIHGVILVTTKDEIDSANPTIGNSNDLLIDNRSSVSYTGNGDDNIPTKPPY